MANEFETSDAAPPLGSSDLDFELIEPGVKLIDGCPSATRDQVYSVDIGTTVNLKFTAKDQNGRPYDLSPFFPPSESTSASASANAAGYRMIAKLQEAAYPERQSCPRDVSIGMIEIDASSGQFKIPFDSEDLEIAPGVYRLQVGLELEGKRRRIWNGLVLCESSLFVDQADERRKYPGPPLESEVRAFLRDAGPDDNRLLGTVEFSQDELLNAYIGPIREFNECVPVFRDLLFDTRIFPWRDAWLKAIAGRLYKTASLSRIRNDVPFQAVGMSVNDQGNWQAYLKLAEDWNKEFQSFVHTTKTSISQRRGYGQFLSIWSFLP